MTKLISVAILFLTVVICATVANKKLKKQAPALTYVQVDTTALQYNRKMYVPVHSKLYTEKRPAGFDLTTVLKIRNTSLSDSLYVSKIDYYDIHGRILRQFIDSVLLVKPMSTAEIIVKKNDFKERGDNFIVEYRASVPNIKPLVQAVISDPVSKIYFTTDGIVINEMDTPAKDAAQ